MDDQISKQTNETKKVCKTKTWTCEACKYTCTNKNKTNHLRIYKHRMNQKKLMRLEINRCS